MSERDMLRHHVAQLMEFFDTVQVFVTKHGNEGTRSDYRGAGNWFARFGQIREWVSGEEAKSRAQEIAEAADDEEDDDEAEGAEA